MNRNPSLLIRLFFIFLLNVILLSIGSIMYGNNTIYPQEFFSMFVIAFFITPLFWLVWEIQVSFGSRGKQKNALLDQQTDTMEKRKRDRIDTVLRDLSDEELHRLSKRLSTINDDELEEKLIGDDGELLINTANQIMS